MLARVGRFLRRSIADQQHDAFKVVRTAAHTDPARIQLAIAYEARIFLDVKVQRERIRDLGVIAHVISYQGRADFSSS